MGKNWDDKVKKGDGNRQIFICERMASKVKGYT